jgi:hypothetical protein
LDEKSTSAKLTHAATAGMAESLVLQQQQLRDGSNRASGGKGMTKLQKVMNAGKSPGAEWFELDLS